MLGNLIGGFITILIGASLIGTVADEVAGARYQNGTPASGASNVSGAASTVLGLVPIFFALGVMSAGVALTVQGMRNAGLM